MTPFPFYRTKFLIKKIQNVLSAFACRCGVSVPRSASRVGIDRSVDDVRATDERRARTHGRPTGKACECQCLAGELTEVTVEKGIATRTQLGVGEGGPGGLEVP